MNKKAFITGISGQDGSYLAELLMEKGYEVHGLIRRTSQFVKSRLEHLRIKDERDKDCMLFLHYGDVTDFSRITELVEKIYPDEIYHLAAQSHVKLSFDQPMYTSNVIIQGVLNILETVRRYNKCLEDHAKIKIYNASSSEMFGNSKERVQNELTRFTPCSPYGIAKLTAHNLACYYREAYDMFICNGILFNHESPRRAESFVTKKIVHSLVKIKLGKQKKLYLGNVDAFRDWGYAPEYVDAMYLMMQQKLPEDYVIATGKSYRVCDFFLNACRKLGLEPEDIIEKDNIYCRPIDVNYLKGDYAKARLRLGWNPSVDFHSLIDIMVEEEWRQQTGEYF